jgi:hypothetical protein
MLAGPPGYNLPYVTMVTCSTDFVSMLAALSTVKLKAHPKNQNLLLEPVFEESIRLMVIKTILKNLND